MPFGFWKSSSQYYDCLSLTSTQVTGMRLFDKTVEMAAIFLHYVPKMAKMRFSRPFLTVKCHLPFSFWDSSSQYYDCLSLASTQVTGMRLYDKTVEMAAIFLHYLPKMSKMRFSRLFLRVKCHLPCSLWNSSSQYYDCLSLTSTQATGLRLFIKNVEIVAFFVHKRPKNGLFLL